MTLFAAASWTLANVVIRVSRETRPVSLLVWSSLVPPLPLLGLAGVVDGMSTVEHQLAGLSGRGMLVVAYAYPSTLVGFAVWNRLIGQHPVARGAPFSLLVPGFGLAAAWVVLDEPIGVPKVLAAVIVLSGLALVLRRGTPAEAGERPTYRLLATARSESRRR